MKLLNRLTWKTVAPGLLLATAALYFSVVLPAHDHSRGGSPPSAARQNDFELHMLSERFAGQHGAACLDGSPPGYYFRKGSDPSRFIVFLRGGGWCFDHTSCKKRSKSSLGSSKKWHRITTFPKQGLFYSEGFSNHSIAVVQYCDGSSFLSQREGVSNGLHYRGLNNFNAVIADLLLVQGLDTATEVLLTGCSAGSLAAIHLADRLAAAVPAARVRVAADSGYFFPHLVEAPTYDTFSDAYSGISTQANLTSMLSTWNLTQFMMATCQLSEGEAWRCFLPYFRLRTVKSRVLVVTSALDWYHTEHVIKDIQCRYRATDIFPCNKEAQGPATAFTASVQRQLVQAVDSSPQHGYWVSKCYGHCFTGVEYTTTLWSSQGMEDVFMRFLVDNGPPERYIGPGDVTGCWQKKHRPRKRGHRRWRSGQYRTGKNAEGEGEGREGSDSKPDGPNGNAEHGQALTEQVHTEQEGGDGVAQVTNIDQGQAAHSQQGQGEGAAQATQSQQEQAQATQSQQGQAQATQSQQGQAQATQGQQEQAQATQGQQEQAQATQSQQGQGEGAAQATNNDQNEQAAAGQSTQHPEQSQATGGSQTAASPEQHSRAAVSEAPPVEHVAAGQGWVQTDTGHADTAAAQGEGKSEGALQTTDPAH